MPSKGKISERFLFQVWQHLPGRADLVTEEGEPVRLIYPGRENDDRGADIKDAVILTEQGLIKGDIEFHLRASDWKRHRHHLDPAYNDTILHVVMWPGNKTATTLQSGERAPVLVLSKYLDRARYQRARTDFPVNSFALPCYRAAKSLSIERIDEILAAAGRERFLNKASAFQRELNRGTPSQILYRGIMRALGYWETHYDFGCYCRDAAPALIGNSRAAAIVVNVILPFAYAWGQLNAQPELVTRSMVIFTVYPKLGTNAVERHMSKQLGRSCVPIIRAQRQQGMIHIYKTLCTQGKCVVCPLSRGK